VTDPSLALRSTRYELEILQDVELPSATRAMGRQVPVYFNEGQAYGSDGRNRPFQGQDFCSLSVNYQYDYGQVVADDRYPVLAIPAGQRIELFAPASAVVRVACPAPQLVRVRQVNFAISPVDVSRADGTRTEEFVLGLWCEGRDLRLSDVVKAFGSSRVRITPLN
jgi:hypothetical protein